jgi:phosphate starvation-inducible PhoH-like protein
LSLFGQWDRHLSQLEKEYGVRLTARGGDVVVLGQKERVKRAAAALSRLAAAVERGDDEVIREWAASGEEPRPDLPEGARAIVVGAKRTVYPKGEGQMAYVQAIEAHDLVIGIGPAGTGKTFLAVAMAVRALLEKRASRIILARPAVEAGESLGFLPGDLQEKVDPYLRPLYDALFTLLGPDRITKYLTTKVVEVVPLAFMRGRTLSDAVAILDEAQNATPMQMKMFLTRLGIGSKAIVTGDITQVDLPAGQPSGLVQVQEILSGLDDVSFIYLTERDVVRHHLVQRVIEAYDAYDRSGNNGQQPATPVAPDLAE